MTNQKPQSYSLIKTPNRAGFSLVEVVVGIGILLLLLFAFGSAVRRVRSEDSSNFVRAENELRTLARAVETYEKTAGQIPTTEQGLSALVSRPSEGHQPREWTPLLSEVPHDPWGRPYQYSAPGKNNAAFDISSLGADGVPSADDIHREAK